MTVLTKATALLTAASERDLEQMHPIDRRCLADACRYWAERAAALQPERPKHPILLGYRSGVLGNLQDGERAP